MHDVDALTVAGWLNDGQEIAFLDVREHGQYGESHPLKVVWVLTSLMVLWVIILRLMQIQPQV